LDGIYVSEKGQMKWAREDNWLLGCLTESRAPTALNSGWETLNS
jgi:hypothetical protein